MSDITLFRESALTHWLSTLKGATRKGYEADIRLFEKAMQLSLEDAWTLPPGQVFVAASSWIAGMSGQPSSINRRLSALKSYFRFLVDAGAMTHSPVEAIKGPTVREPEYQVMSVEDFKAMLRACSGACGDRDWVILSMMAETGMRRFEIAGLDIGNIKKINGETVLDFYGKREKHRMIPLSPLLSERLWKYINSTTYTLRAEDPVFLSSKSDQRVALVTLNQIITRRAKQAGLKNVTPHSFRHFAITEAAKVEDSDLKLLEFSGHASVQTLRRYTHFNKVDTIGSINARRESLYE